MWGYRNQCGTHVDENGLFTASTTTVVTFLVSTSSAAPTSYSASVVFFRLPEDGANEDASTTTNGPQMHPSNTNISLSQTFSYETTGYYLLGYNLTFGEGVPDTCQGQTLGHAQWIYFDGRNCVFDAAPPNTATTAAVASGDEDSGGHDETMMSTPASVTTATTTTADIVDAISTTTSSMMYTNPQDNEYFCGDTLSNIVSDCLHKKPCPGGMAFGNCDTSEGCFRVTECASQYDGAASSSSSVAETTVPATTTTTLAPSPSSTGASSSLASPAVTPPSTFPGTDVASELMGTTTTAATTPASNNGGTSATTTTAEDVTSTYLSNVTTTTTYEPTSAPTTPNVSLSSTSLRPTITKRPTATNAMQNQYISSAHGVDCFIVGKGGGIVIKVLLHWIVAGAFMIM